MLDDGNGSLEITFSQGRTQESLIAKRRAFAF
jgi:hypothetical protein